MAGRPTHRRRRPQLLPHFVPAPPGAGRDPLRFFEPGLAPLPGL